MTIRKGVRYQIKYHHLMGPAPAKQQPLRLMEMLIDNFLQVDLLSTNSLQTIFKRKKKSWFLNNYKKELGTLVKHLNTSNIL